MKQCLSDHDNVVNYPLQNPQIRSEMERDPSRIIRQIAASPYKPLVFIDEAQKVPEIFDSVQYLIDERILMVAGVVLITVF